jgi:D-psicose/D-tagatose/L-ribulose 3-epimerase
MALQYAIHAYAWTIRWSNEDLWIIEHARDLGFDAIEIPLMDPGEIDARKIRERAESSGLHVLGSLALPEGADPAHEDPGIRRHGRNTLLRCVDLTAAMGGTILTGVIYSAIGRRIDRRPDDSDYERSAAVLCEVARHGAERGVTIGIEPVNRYETFLVNTAAQALRLRELVGEPNVGVHLDAYHMNIEENDFYTSTLSVLPHLVHFHLSESHRGIPGRGTVDWQSIMRALADGGYTGYVGLESFAGISEAMRPATCIWRELAPNSDTLVREGLAYLKAVEHECSASRAGRTLPPSC